MKKKKLSIVTNTYFAEAFIKRTLTELREIAAKVRKDYSLETEIIIVDDGSKDKTIEILQTEYTKHQDFKLIILTRNFGGINSYLAGMEYASGDAVIHIASDLQEPPYLIPQMIDKWLQEFKFVCCIRKNRKDPFLSIIFAKLFNFIFSKYVLPGYPSGGFDMVLIDNEVKEKFINCREKNYSPQHIIFWLGYKAEYIYYDRQERVSGKSGWTFSKKCKLAIDAFISMSYLPIRFISMIGIVVAISSGLYGISIIINKILGNITVEGWSTLITGISFLLGLIIIMLGIIGEYLWRILDQVRSRPHYVINKIMDYEKK